MTIPDPRILSVCCKDTQMKFDVHGTSHVCYDSLCCQSRLRHKLVAKLSEQTQLWYMITPAAGKQSIQNAFVSCLVYSGCWSQITHTKPSTIHWNKESLGKSSPARAVPRHRVNSVKKTHARGQTHSQWKITLLYSCVLDV